MKDKIIDLNGQFTIAEHLRVLGKTFLMLGGLFIVLSAVLFAFSDKIFMWMSSYYGIAASKIVTISPFEQINTQIYVAIALAGVMLLPLFVFNVYSYLKPVFSDKWRIKVRNNILVIGFLGVLGFAFGLTTLSKLTLSVLMQYQTFNAMWSLGSIVNSVVFMGLCGAAVLQIAPAIILLNKLRIVNLSVIKKYRLYIALALSLIIGVVTPGADIISQVVLFVPAYLSFEVGLFFAGRQNKVQLNTMEVKQNVRIR